MQYIFIGLIAVAGLGFHAWPTRNQINMCAIEVARQDYERGYDNHQRTQEDADQSFIVDNGLRPDFISVAEGYKRSIGLRTVYDDYVDKGFRLAIWKNLTFQKIEWPQLKVADGYHVTRSNGGAALVKDGDPDPLFRCMEGYVPDGHLCVKSNNP